jgi:hypothetical protein
LYKPDSLRETANLRNTQPLKEGFFVSGLQLPRASNYHKKEKEDFKFSIFSTFSFFTNGFQIFSGIQEGFFSGAFTCSRHPLLRVPFSFHVPDVESFQAFFFPFPLFVAFSAVCLGCFPVKIPCSLPSSFHKQNLVL